MCILMISGCQKEKTKEVEKEPFEFGGFKSTVHTIANDIKISADVNYVPFETLEFSFTEPQAFNGASVILNDGEYVLSAKGLTFTLPADKMPFSMMCNTLEYCLENVRGKTPETENDAAFYSYEAGGHICRLYVNKDSKCFEKLSVDGIDTLFFENFIFSP